MYPPPHHHPHHYSLTTLCFRSMGWRGAPSSTLNPARTRLRHVSILPATSPPAETKVINVSHFLCRTAHILYELRPLCVSVSVAVSRRSARFIRHHYSTPPYCPTCTLPTPFICASLHFALHFEGSSRHHCSVSVFYTLVTYSVVSALVDI